VSTYQPTTVGPAWLHPVVTPHLRQGEVLLGAVQCGIDDLLPLKVPRAYRWKKPKRSADVESWFGALFDTIFPEWMNPFAVSWRGPALGRRSYRAIRRPFHGGSWSGGWRSTAGQLLSAVRNAAAPKILWDKDDVTLVLTSHRLLLLSSESRAEQPQAEHLLAELPRGAYVRRREPHPARQAYRLDLAFGDGSWLAFRMGETGTVPAVATLLD